MKSQNKKLLLILLGVGIIALISIILFSPRIDIDFPNIYVEEAHKINNKTDIEYLDKIISVGLREVDMDTIYLTVYPLTDEEIENSDLDLVGRVIPGTPGTSQYIMQLDENMVLRDIIKTVAHEIVHIQQYQSGRFIAKRDELGNLTGMAVWNGWEYDIAKLSYEKYPWETEAYEKDDALYKKMIDKLYGKFE